MRTKYKSAGREFAKLLYTVAKPHCRISEFLVVREQSYTAYWDSSDWSNDERVELSRTVYLVRQAECYIALATLLAEKAPDTIDLKLMGYLQSEVLGREMVDA
ncbi:hypothetical protein LTR36_003472 [Oleoguttula mirabilis]|uniref:Uncharacterized protein n=1 Tax=Oleoguttula mirabilis TaxID=1507867 RepID=A0AAV9JLB7_9PEZI|nr:hypothetical protein LTR36_003472 [Oleoguttula mirabilis]